MLRPLAFARPHTPAQAAEAAEALRWLAGQPVPAGAVAGFVLAVARQHIRRGLSLRKLVEAGWRPGLSGEGLWGWRVREGMVRVLR